MMIQIVEISLVGLLVLISLWLALINLSIFKITDELLTITVNLNRETETIRLLSQEIASNTGLPDEWRVPPLDGETPPTP